jgi:HSP20 family protein
MDFFDLDMGEDLDLLHNRMRKMVDEILKTSRPLMVLSDRAWNPSLNVYETSDEVVILMEAAGVKREELKITLEKNILRISGRREEPPFPFKMRLHQMEIYFGSFERSARIYAPVDEERITATYKDGFLRVNLPKREKITIHEVEVLKESK